MFQLFKKRDFGDNISDTIAFFKTYGKHYFKNYFSINGIFLMVLVVLFYFMSKVYMQFIFSLTNPQNKNTDYLSAYFNDNIVLFAVTIILFFLLSIFISIINFAYPVIYLEFLEKQGNNNFTTKDIIKAIKNQMGRLLVFFLGMLFIVTPIVFIVFALNILLCFILIGIPLFFVTLPAFMSWFALSFNEYIIKKVGFFEALGNGLSLLRQRFWLIIGTTLAMIVMIQVIQGIITMIPYIAGMFFVFVTAGSAQDGSMASPNDALSGMMVIFSVIMVLSVLMSYIFNNFIFINQGLIYYSLREENENNSSKSEIDLIGTDSE